MTTSNVNKKMYIVLTNEDNNNGNNSDDKDFLEDSGGAGKKGGNDGGSESPPTVLPRKPNSWAERLTEGFRHAPLCTNELPYFYGFLSCTSLYG